MSSYTKVISEMKNDSLKYGNKAAADIAFNKLKVGPEVAVFDKGTSAKVIERHILKRFGTNQRYVVRFSKGNEINLPVAIGISFPELVSFIESKIKPDYSVIIRPFFEVKNCFEVYYDGKTTQVQVLPGKWDITTNEKTDLIVIHSDKMIIYRYEKERPVKGLDVSISQPLSVTELELIGNFAQQHKPVLDAFLQISNPLFMRGHHEITGGLSFSNCRKSTAPYEIEEPKNTVYTILGEKDVAAWDGKGEIYVDVSALSREEDKSIYKIALLLKKRGATKVYCKSFLSHQAILLREAGLTTVQLFEPKDYSVKIIQIK